MGQIPLQVNLTFQQLEDLIRRLSSSEKLKINDLIWSTNSNVPMEHQLLVSERIENSKKDPSRMLDWDEVSKTL